MVGNDEFRQHVPKHFQAASRAVFNGMDPERAVRLTLNAASTAFKAGGCPGLDRVGRIASEGVFMNSDVQTTDTDRLLENVAREYANDRTARAVRAAKLLRREHASRIVPNAPDGQEIAERFVVDFIAASLFNPRLSQALITTGQETHVSYESRCREFLNDLRRSTGLPKLAADLLADPGGSQVTQQRAKRQGRDPLTEAFLPLTAD